MFKQCQKLVKTLAENQARCRILHLLFTRYALRLLHVAMVSLRRAHHDHSALGVADAASAAVDRSLRIIHHSVAELGDRADLLKPKNARGQLSSVQEMAQWAWDEVRLNEKTSPLMICDLPRFMLDLNINETKKDGIENKCFSFCGLCARSASIRSP